MRPWLATLALAVVLAVPASAAAPVHHRRWTAAVTAPAQFDLTAAHVGFTVPHGARRPALAMAVGQSGLDYVAVAAPGFDTALARSAYVLVVNRRPRGSEAADLAQVDLTATLSRPLARPRTDRITDALGTASTDHTATRLCESLPGGNEAIDPSTLHALTARGSAISGFDTASAVAQGLDAACGRPVDAAFRAAVAQSSPNPPCPTCDPKPGYACPDIACPQP